MTLRELTEAIKKHEAPFSKIYMCSKDLGEFFNELSSSLGIERPGNGLMWSPLFGLTWNPHYASIDIRFDSLLKFGEVRFE